MSMIYFEEGDVLGSHVSPLDVLALSGETGSGKSELRRLAIKSLIDLSLSSPGKKGAKLGQQIPNAEVRSPPPPRV
jgi:ABC-type dipeptide/oligopeptide/nickel transport system ATPase component